MNCSHGAGVQRAGSPFRLSSGAGTLQAPYCSLMLSHSLWRGTGCIKQQGMCKGAVPGSLTALLILQQKAGKEQQGLKGDEQKGSPLLYYPGMSRARSCIPNDWLAHRLWPGTKAAFML